MISRALDREIADFVDLLETHLARLIHAGQARTQHLSRSEHEVLMQDALVAAWRCREQLDPVIEPVATWFERCLSAARGGHIVPTLDELFVLSKLSPAPAAARSLSSASSQEGVSTATAASGSDATVKLGKECPPCWRCRYFDGWLPKRWPYPEGWQPKDELDQVCFEIDKRKVEIAKFVQGAYDPALLED